PLPVDPASGQKISVLDVSAEPMNDSAGAGALSTATDYLRFAQMLLNGGELDGVRLLSRSTIKLMTSGHLFLGRSQGGDRRRLHDPGAEPDPRVLPQDVQRARLSGPRGLKASRIANMRGGGLSRPRSSTFEGSGVLSQPRERHSARIAG